MIFRRELCNLKNPEEAELLVRIAGICFRPDGPPKPLIIIISDETPEGRDEILKIIKNGGKVLSIRD